MQTARALTTTAALVAALGLVMGWAAPLASAHVTVAAPGVSVGDSDAVIDFRVPDESATASTVELRLQLPTDTPLAGVLVAPVPGWRSTVTVAKLAKPITTDDGAITEVVSEIDWKSDAAAAIRSGYFGQFAIIVGKLPDDVDRLTFKVIQIYSDQHQVAWIEVPAAGSTASPEHPAPTLSLSRAATSPAATGAPSPTQAGATGNAGASKRAATTGIVLGGTGVVLGASALVLALRRRRPSARRTT